MRYSIHQSANRYAVEAALQPTNDTKHTDSKRLLSRNLILRLLLCFAIFTVRLCCFERLGLSGSSTRIERLLSRHGIRTREDLNDFASCPYHKAVASRDIKERILHVVELHQRAIGICYERKARPQASFVLFQRLTVVPGDGNDLAALLRKCRVSSLERPKFRRSAAGKRLGKKRDHNRSRLRQRIEMHQLSIRVVSLKIRRYGIRYRGSPDDRHTKCQYSSHRPTPSSFSELSYGPAKAIIKSMISVQ